LLSETTVPVVKLAEQDPPIQLLMPAGEEETDPPAETFTVKDFVPTFWKVAVTDLL
jgi:hypothetical protein